MEDPGVNSGWTLMYISLGCLSAYAIASFGDPFLALPRLIEANTLKGADPTKVKGTVYATVTLIFSFPVWGLLPLLSFLCWAANSAYGGGSIWFIASFGYFALLAFLTLQYSGWMPLPVLHYYLLVSAFSFFLFLVTQLGMYNQYNYRISGAMSAAVSAVPLLYGALVAGTQAQTKAFKTHNIEEADVLVYETTIKPCTVKGHEVDIKLSIPFSFLFLFFIF